MKLPTFIRKWLNDPQPGDRFKRGHYLVELVKINSAFATIRPVRIGGDALDQTPMVITRLRFNDLYLKGWI